MKLLKLIFNITAIYILLSLIFGIETAFIALMCIVAPIVFILAVGVLGSATSRSEHIVAYDKDKYDYWLPGEPAVTPIAFEQGFFELNSMHIKI